MDEGGKRTQVRRREERKKDSEMRRLGSFVTLSLPSLTSLPSLFFSSLPLGVPALRRRTVGSLPDLLVIVSTIQIE